MHKSIFRIYHFLLATETFLLQLLLFGAILLASTQIFMRNFFDSGIFWADSALRILVLWIGMIGAMFASRNKKHIRIDVLSQYLPEPVRNIVWRFTELATAVICGIVAWYSIEFIQFEYEDGMMAFANVPVWLAESIIPFAFVVMSLRYFFYALTPAYLHNPEPGDINPPDEFQ